MEGRRLFPGFEAIADPRFREDVMRTRFVGLKFLPQVSNKHSKIFRLLYAVRAPNSRQQFSMRKHAAGISCHVDQEIELFGREMHVAIAYPDIAG
jgi:hypothetical protein